LLGQWRNFDDLEENLCVDELILIINSIREKEHREHKFIAALQGVDLDEEELDQEDKSRDILTLVGTERSEAGFGIGLGLGYMEVGND
jgi:hypothetical protein